LGVRDHLIMLYSLTPFDGFSPQLAEPGVTHELSVYEVDPATPVDYAKSLLEQKRVSPLTPCRIAYQVKAASGQEVVERIEWLIDRLLDGSLEVDQPSEWKQFFKNDCCIAILDAESEQARRVIADASKPVAPAFPIGFDPRIVFIGKDGKFKRMVVTQDGATTTVKLVEVILSPILGPM